MKRILFAAILTIPMLARAQVGGAIADPGVYTPYVATGGSQARTAQDRNSEVYNLRDFSTASGALPCSGSDDIAAFNAALAKLSAAGGGRLLLPSATCLVSAPVVLPGGSVGYGLIKIVGQGPATIVSPSASMTSVFIVPSGQNDIEDLSIINVSSFSMAGVMQTKAQNNLPTRYTNLRIIGFSKGIQIETGDNYDISSNFFLNNSLSISLEDKCINGRIRSNYMLGGNGINFPVAPTQQCEGVAIDHNDILPGANGSYALQILSGLQIDLTDNIFDQVTNGPGVNIDATNHAVADITFKGGWIGAQGGATSQTNGLNVVGTSSSGVQNLTVEAVSFVGWLGYDISASNTNSLNLVDNHLNSTTDIGNVYLLNAAATLMRGNNMKHASSSVTEAGTTVTYATTNVFGASPVRNAASQYMMNNGDSYNPFGVGYSAAGNSRFFLNNGNGTAVLQAEGPGSVFAVIQSAGSAGVLLAPGGTTKFVVNSNYSAMSNAFADQSEQVVTSGSSATVGLGVGRVELHGTASPFTLTMAATPQDGQQLLLECDQAEVLTVAANSGQSMTGSATACSTTQGHLWHYSTAYGSWHMAY